MEIKRTCGKFRWNQNTALSIRNVKIQKVKLEGFRIVSGVICFFSHILLSHTPVYNGEQDAGKIKMSFIEQ